MTRCEATTAAGARCRRRAAAGTDRCAQHATGGPDPARTDRLLALLSAGNRHRVALDAAGIDPGEFDAWVADPGFRRRVERAAAEGEARNVALVAKAAASNWQAAAWLLERSHPERWARVSQRGDLPVDQPKADAGPRDEFTDLDELAARRATR